MSLPMKSRKPKRKKARSSKRKRAEELVGMLTTSNLLRVAEGELPLDFGRGDAAALAIGDLGEVTEELEKAAQRRVKQLKKQQKGIKIHNPITVKKNNFGHAHIWKGDVRDKIGGHGRNWTVDGKDSDLYFQNDYDVEALKDYMTVEQIEDFDGGFAIIMDDAGYF